MKIAILATEKLYSFFFVKKMKRMKK